MFSRADQNHPAHRSWLAASVASALAAVLFLAPWWNRHLGLSLDGYMPWFGHRILMGEIPYRDFFLHLPPLHPLAEALLEAVAGKSIVAGRAAGAIGHILMAVLLAAWLSRRYRPGLAVFASLAALAVATSDGTEILDLYNPHAALAAVAAGLFACIALDGGRRARLFGWLSGAAAGVSIWTKQTVGLGASVAVPVAILLIILRDPDFRPAGCRLVARFAAGWAAVAMALSGWLAFHGAFREFLQQVFADAAGSKGSPFGLLLRPWRGPFEMPVELRDPGIVAALLAIGCVAATGWGVPRARTRLRGVLSSVAGLAGASLALALASWIAFRIGLVSGGDQRRLLELLKAGRWTTILFALYGITLLCGLIAWNALRRKLEVEERELVIFGLVAGAVATMQALSMSATGALAFPALALFTCHVLDRLPRRALSIAVVVPLLALNGVAIVSSVGILHNVPFNFAGWYEVGFRRADVESQQVPLAGLTLSRRTVTTVDGIVSALRRASDPGEPIFTYSVYPIFYWLADRPPATFASLHWTDVTPDRIVDRDLAALRENPPVAVVWQYLREFDLAGNEAYFRAGRPSSLRRMNAGLAELLETRYVKVAEFPHRADGRRGPPLEVWVRADRAAERGLVESP